MVLWYCEGRGYILGYNVYLFIFKIREVLRKINLFIYLEFE